MKLTPLDIRRQEFKRVVRGIDPEEVSVFLDMVAGEYERILRESKALIEERDELKRKVDELDGMREAIQGAVVMAKKSSDEVLSQAKKEAELRLKEAEVESERILEDARREVALFKKEIDEIKNQRSILVGRLKSLLDGQTKMLEAYVGDWEQDERRMRSAGQFDRMARAGDARQKEAQYEEAHLSEAVRPSIHPDGLIEPRIEERLSAAGAPGGGGEEGWTSELKPGPLKSQSPADRPGFLRPPRPTVDRDIFGPAHARRGVEDVGSELGAAEKAPPPADPSVRELTPRERK